MQKYFNLGSVYKEVAAKYVDEVDKGIFPTFENSFTVDDEVIKMLENN